MAGDTSEYHQLGQLFRQWTIWYLIPDRYTMRDTNWNDFLHMIGSFSTINEFWDSYNAMEKISRLPKGCRYYIFKSGVTPLWEDTQNNGGFEITVEKAIPRGKKEIDNKWVDLIAGVIGETFTNINLVNGVEIVVKSEMYRLGVWTAPCTNAVRDQITSELVKLIGWNGQPKVSKIIPPAK